VTRQHTMQRALDTLLCWGALVCCVVTVLAWVVVHVAVDEDLILHFR
jgi:hypothetical protein